MAKNRTRLKPPASIKEALRFRPRVNVTQLVIDNSQRGNDSMCIVTRGIAYTYPQAVRIKADTSVIRFSLGLYRYTYLTQSVVMPKIVAWDIGKEVKPFSFILDKPIGVIPVHSRIPSATNTGHSPTRFNKAHAAEIAKRGSNKGGTKWNPDPEKRDRSKRTCHRRSSTRWHGLVVPSEIEKMVH